MTKRVEVVSAAGRIPQLLRRAFTLLRCGRPGPVLLEVSPEVMNEEVAGETVEYVPVRGAPRCRQ
ncbi:MAG: hypothetical protein HY660_16955 [Armatimonadetes bacterium]|nr:hypothetical protein [Armatimonadota bacterium]